MLTFSYPLVLAYVLVSQITDEKTTYELQRNLRGQNHKQMEK